MSTHDNGAIETPEWQPEPHEWDETAYLMASPANAERLRAALRRQFRAGIGSRPDVTPEFIDRVDAIAEMLAPPAPTGFGTYPEPLDGRGDN